LQIEFWSLLKKRRPSSTATSSSFEDWFMREWETCRICLPNAAYPFKCICNTKMLVKKREWTAYQKHFTRKREWVRESDVGCISGLVVKFLRVFLYPHSTLLKSVSSFDSLELFTREKWNENQTASEISQVGISSRRSKWCTALNNIWWTSHE
jgi:hypothetical protein